MALPRDLLVVVPQPQIQRQSAAHSPVVLNVVPHRITFPGDRLVSFRARIGHRPSKKLASPEASPCRLLEIAGQRTVEIKTTRPIGSLTPVKLIAAEVKPCLDAVFAANDSYVIQELKGINGKQTIERGDPRGKV